MFQSEMAGNQEGLGDLWSGGRQLLRQYLQEVGFTDTILDARSARLRALLGNSAPNDGKFYGGTENSRSAPVHF
jgi:hypothetical protein